MSVRELTHGAQTEFTPTKQLASELVRDFDVLLPMSEREWRCWRGLWEDKALGGSQTDVRFVLIGPFGTRPKNADMKDGGREREQVYSI